MRCGWLAAALWAVAGVAHAQQAGGAPRPAAPAEDGNFRYAYVEIYQPFFARTERDGVALYETRRPRAIPGRFPARKAAGAKRVFIVGGSVAGELGDGVPRQCLARALPKRAVEVVNCGMAAYDSYRDALVAEEVLGYDPDLIVVLSGNNEMTHFPLRVNLTLHRADRTLSGFGFYRALKERLRNRGQGASHPDPAVRLPVFEANLRRMARLARRRGVPLVLCTLPANVRDMPPRSIPDFEDWSDPVWTAAWAAMEREEYRRAAGLFGGYAAAHPGLPQGHFYRAKALDLSGDRAAAGRFYRLAKEYDTNGCGATRNRVIRKVCASEAGCILADLDSAFSRAAPDGLPGGDFFSDGMHWYFQHNRFVMAAILEAVRRHDRSGAAPAFENPEEWGEVEPPEGARTRWEAITPRDNPVWYAVKGVLDARPGARWEQSIAMFQAAYRLHAPLLTGLIGQQAQARAMVSSSVWTQGAEDKVASGWARVLEHAGEALRREGDRAGARRFLDEALRLDPGLSWARRFRALAAAP